MKIFFILFLLLSSLYSHPHTFIDLYPTIKVKDDKTQSIHFKWVLDEMTSTILIMELDQDMDGTINEKENKNVQKNYFYIFENYSYYTHIIVDGKVLKSPKVKNFKASIENNRICYSFDMGGNYNIKNTIFEFGDTDFYVAMVLKDEFVKVDGATAITTGVDNDFYYGYRLELK
ncbi:MAG: hypothetical protein DRG78_19135 [Epsilonproteobacteria bacterium]|nr:MAG: hypothetical protein DRG78_19135 [Campylobacterota bacterium]